MVSLSHLAAPPLPRQALCFSRPLSAFELREFSTAGCLGLLSDKASAGGGGGSGKMFRSEQVEHTYHFWRESC